MKFEHALNTAQLWRDGKMIGGDEDAVRNALLAEVERLRPAIQGEGLSPGWIYNAALESDLIDSTLSTPENWVTDYGTSNTELLAFAGRCFDAGLVSAGKFTVQR
jgi:hypothetical protein